MAMTKVESTLRRGSGFKRASIISKPMPKRCGRCLGSTWEWSRGIRLTTHRWRLPERTTTGPTTTVVEQEGGKVVLDDYRFVPAVLSPGSVTAIRAQNHGGLEHTWSVLEQPIEAEPELGSAAVLAEARVEVGQSAIVDIGGLEPGRYQVVCVIPGHVSAGMVGELVIDG